ncbi:metallopeptidase domain-containing protein [Nocardioides acrostichi]|uniref:Uncharacterized protein n=1 Tax=Nocardioides acrostichi TaxID=2784339 RepID=A0A930UY80_9ACTN|nr:hypothetical protein [Nocardioides acrostichi]MBF4160185.1 hypothetical protein [Nocardioides acrostichi]
MNSSRTRAVGIIGAIALAVGALAMSPVTAAAVSPTRSDSGSVSYLDPGLVGTATHVVRGRLDIATRDTASGAGRVVYGIERGPGHYRTLRFDAAVPAVTAGTPVRAEVTDDGTVARATFSPSVRESAAPRTVPTSPQTPGPQHLYIAEVTNVGTYDYGDAEIATRVDRTLARWVTESDGMITSFDRVGAIEHYATQVDCSNGSALYNEAAGQFPDVSFAHSGPNHLLVVVPAGVGCEYALGSNGSPDAPFGGGRATVAASSSFSQALMHELGHNFSLAHAGREVCDPTCSVSTYADHYNFMGSSFPDDWGIIALSSVQRRQLGITQHCEVPELDLPEGQGTSTRTYDLLGRGTDSGTRGVLVTDPSTGDVYGLDWRNRLGRDDHAIYGTYGASNDKSGLVVERYQTDRRLILQTYAPRDPSDDYDTSRLAGESAVRGGMSVHVDRYVGAADPAVSGSLPPAVQVTVTLTDPGVDTAPALPAQQGTAEVVGDVVSGATVRARAADWTSGSCYTYQWNVDGRPVDGAISPTFAIPDDWQGRDLSVTITGQQSARATRTSTSTPVTVGRQAFTTSPRPVIRGVKRVGKVLRARHRTWEPTPTTFRYRWSANGRRLQGRTASTLRLGRTLKGKRITVRVIALRDGYQTTRRVSKPTSRIR